MTGKLLLRAACTGRGLRALTLCCCMTCSVPAACTGGQKEGHHSQPCLHVSSLSACRFPPSHPYLGRYMSDSSTLKFSPAPSFKEATSLMSTTKVTLQSYSSKPESWYPDYDEIGQCLGTCMLGICVMNRQGPSCCMAKHDFEPAGAYMQPGKLQRLCWQSVLCTMCCLPSTVCLVSTHSTVIALQQKDKGAENTTTVVARPST